MKLKTPKTAIAALTTNSNIDAKVGVAALTFTVGEINADNPNRVQLFPDGTFKAKDGRPWEVTSGHWLMDNLAFQLISDDAAKRENDFHFDYEHQTLNAEFNGEPAPAAGWFREFEYIEGEGLFALNVKWTPKAAEFIKNSEYRFTSPVFTYDIESGRILSIQHAALTNDPALDGMKAVEALKSRQTSLTKTNPTGENHMPDLLKVLLGKIGIEIPEDFETNTAALKQVETDAITAIAALKTKADKSGNLEKDLNTAQQNVAALKAGGSKEVDPSKFVPIATYNAVNTELAALKNGTDENSVEQLLKDNAAKITGQADRDYLATVGKSQGAAALKAMLEPRVAIAALTTTQTKGKKKPADENTGELTADQIAVCKNMNITQAQFKAQLAKGSN